MPDKKVLIDDQGVSLHRRLIDGDITASAEIAETYLPYLIKHLQKKYPEIRDQHLLATAANDALLSYLDKPQSYIPTKARLGTYLCMAARGDLLNLLEREKRHTGHFRLLEDVEFEERPSEYKVVAKDEVSLEEQVLNRLSSVWQMLRELLPDLKDRRMIELMMEGERDTAAYADVLGIGDQSFEKQKAIVKRHKDRIKKVLQRNINRAELDNE